VFPIDDPAAQDLLQQVAAATGDTVAAGTSSPGRAIKFLFAEAKRTKKDAIRATQLGWLSKALDCGLTEDNFLLVEWTFGET